MDLAEFEKWNERMSKIYDPDSFITKTAFPIRWVEKKRLAKTLAAVACDSSSRILDLGCGPGNLTTSLTGNLVVGVDLSEAMLQQARARLASNSAITIVKGNAESIPFPDGHFNRIVCSEVLEHVQRPEVVFREIRRVAQSGARIVLTLPNEQLINRTKKLVRAFGLMRWMAGGYKMSRDMLDRWHLSEIRPDWILNLCAEEFELIAHHRIPFPFLAYHNIFVFIAK